MVQSLASEEKTHHNFFEHVWGLTRWCEILLTVLLDHSQVFDFVSYQLLLAKLFRFQGSAILCVNSYLQVSSLFKKLRGVPQDAAWAP